ncbi:TPA: hypothetical protein ITS83_000001, partial [Enterococcus faecalis]|nr:hypothetical protein [Enterococcus faecalis]
MKHTKLVLLASLMCIGAGSINTVTVKAAQQVNYSDSAVQNAVSAVDALFTDATHTELSPNTTK